MNRKRGAPIKSLTLASPMDGFLITRNAFRGQRVTPEMELYSIADLATIWVMADVYEYEVPMIRVGQAASMTFPYFPGKTYQGKVTYIYPQLDNQTRTLKAATGIPQSRLQAETRHVRQCGAPHRLWQAAGGAGQRGARFGDRANRVRGS